MALDRIDGRSQIDEISRKAVICRRSCSRAPLGERGDARILEAVMQHDKLTATLAAMLERLDLERKAAHRPSGAARGASRARKQKARQTRRGSKA